jgi:tRNA nucleotidyltransferase (CCA-adding enzyme)
MRTPAEALEALRASPCGARLLATLSLDDGVWLVGGAVRDLLLGRPARELDLVVDGPVETMAQRLAGPEGEVLVHERFGTATVHRDGCGFDLASARRERYAAPGALPDVEPATLREDLGRRDFTVNAIALALDGEVVAAPEAFADLDAGHLRVLHDASFVDDPTRVWRLARYAARLGFAPEPGTAALTARADPATVSGARHGNELRLTLREPGSVATEALTRIAGLNRGWLPEGFDPRPSGLADACALLPAGARTDLLILAACTVRMDLRALLAWLDALGFRAQERDTVGAASRESTWRPLRAARTPSEIARAARGAPLEAIALAGGDNARRWLDELRQVSLEISGEDLVAAGVPQGPAVGRALARALEAKLDGVAIGREAELAAALAADRTA